MRVPQSILILLTRILSITAMLGTLGISTGWTSDPVLNELFYQDFKPERYYQLDILDLEKLPRPENTRKRKNWWPSESEPIQKWETTGIKFAGYFHGAESTQEFWTKPGIESLTVFFGDYPHASEKRKILRCYIPDSAKHPTWTERTLTSLSNRNTRVIIFGRLIWDNYLSKDWVFICSQIRVEQNNVFVNL